MIQAKNITADGYFPDANGITTKGGMSSWVASGNFGGGSLSLECKIEGVTDWVRADDNGTSSVFTEAGVKNVLLDVFTSYRVKLAGSTGADMSFGL